MSQPAPEPQKNVSVKVSAITPRQAEIYLSATCFPFQRKVRPRHVWTLAEQMRRGEWRPYGSVLHFNAVGEDLYLIDGQHRLHAVIEAQVEQKFIVLTERVPDFETVQRNYMVMDTGERRSLADAARALHLADRLQMSDRELLSLNAASRLIEYRFVFNSRKRNASDHYEGIARDAALRRLERWHSCALPYYEAVRSTGKLHTRLIYTPVAAVGIVTVRQSEEKALPFWRAVASNDGLRRDTPEWKLVNYLRDSSPLMEGQAVFVRKVAACWNAYHRGETYLQRIIAREDYLPLLIEGTEFEG